MSPIVGAARRWSFLASDAAPVEGDLMSSSPVAQQLIVVDVEGSPASADALRRAARQAHLTSAPLRVVIAWYLPTPTATTTAGQRRWPASTLRATPKPALAQLVSRVLGDTPAVRVEQQVQEGNPVMVVLGQAKDASVLVVGGPGARCLHRDAARVGQRALRQPRAVPGRRRPRRRRTERVELTSARGTLRWPLRSPPETRTTMIPVGSRPRLATRVRGGRRR